MESVLFILSNSAFKRASEPFAIHKIVKSSPFLLLARSNYGPFGGLTLKSDLYAVTAGEIIRSSLCLTMWNRSTVRKYQSPQFVHGVSLMDTAELGLFLISRIKVAMVAALSKEENDHGFFNTLHVTLPFGYQNAKRCPEPPSQGLFLPIKGVLKKAKLLARVPLI